MKTFIQLWNETERYREIISNRKFSYNDIDKFKQDEFSHIFSFFIVRLHNDIKNDFGYDGRKFNSFCMEWKRKTYHSIADNFDIKKFCNEFYDSYK